MVRWPAGRVGRAEPQARQGNLTWRVAAGGKADRGGAAGPAPSCGCWWASPCSRSGSAVRPGWPRPTRTRRPIRWGGDGPRPGSRSGGRALTGVQSGLDRDGGARYAAPAAATMSGPTWLGVRSSVDGGGRSMLRLLVTIYLIVATLVGARPCPCPAPIADATSPAPSVPAKGVARTCGCCTPSVPTNTSAAQSAGRQRPDQPSAPCQCQCGKQDTAAVRALWRSGKSAVGFDGADGPVLNCVIPGPVPDRHALAVGQLRDRPHCSTDDLLYSFHRLRC